MIPSPTSLTYFLEVAESQNVSRAAERLGITQPSLTLAIQRLERDAGAALLVRGKRGVTLTPAGNRLASRARILLQEWQKIRLSTLGAETEVSGTYTIGCHPSVALYSLPHFLPGLLKDFPDLEIQLVHDLSRKITEGIISLRIDLGLVINPVQHPSLVLNRLCTDEVTFWASTATEKKPKTLDDAAKLGLPLICDPDLLQTQDLLRKLRNSKKGEALFRNVVPTSSLEVIASLAASGAGIGVLPERVALRDPNSPLIKLSGSPIFHDELCLAYRVENRKTPTLRTISERIRRAFA